MKSAAAAKDMKPETGSRTRTLKVCSIVGARPQFIKAAMVGRAIRHFNRESRSVRIREVLVHTGQHYDREMDRVFFDELKVREPDYHLGVGSGPHGGMTGRMLMGIEMALLAENPDWVLVYGDTNSTLAGAFCAAKIPLPVAHVEAGLRSRNLEMPEEVNRILTDRLSALLFAPTLSAVRNLRKEGIRRGVYRVGDITYDAFIAYRRLASRQSDILARLRLRPGEYCLATVHRQENTDDPARLLSIARALSELARKHLSVIIPLHPRTRQALKQWGIELAGPRVRVIAPLRYLDLIALLISARGVLTDSGGIQKESFFARVPCLTLRGETEWEETVTSGLNRLVGANRKAIVEGFGWLLEGGPPDAPGPGVFYGNGDAGSKIVKALVSASPFDLKAWKPCP
jgi:UDP-GlcNAc3NAcA epimerase